MLGEASALSDGRPAMCYEEYSHVGQVISNGIVHYTLRPYRVHVTCTLGGRGRWGGVKGGEGLEGVDGREEGVGEGKGWVR